MNLQTQYVRYELSRCVHSHRDVIVVYVCVLVWLVLYLWGWL
jgi:hypothetical protein